MTDRRQALIDRLPLWLIIRPEQMLLAVLCEVVGLSTLIGEIDPRSLAASLSPGLVNVWAGALVIGSTLVILGVTRRRAQLERLGVLLMGATSAYYAASIFVEIGFKGGGAAAGLIVGFALLKWLRAFLISSAPQVRTRLRREMAERADEYLTGGL